MGKNGCGFGFGNAGGGSGGGTMNVIVTGPGNYNLTAAESGNIFTNEGSEGSKHFILPDEPPIGTWYIIQVVDPHSIFVEPESGEIIQTYASGPAPFGVNTDQQPGQSYYIVYAKTGVWEIVSEYGIWSVVVPP